jgi:NADPH:quinone reductase-like Zn-dependent oxidoreductase
LPAPKSSQVQVKVVAVGVPPLVRGRALGKHPSARGAALPFDPSVDGVAQDEATGDLFYVGPMGAQLFAERANVERSHLVKLASGADPIAVATLVNPVSSSWMALRCRALPGSCEGATVLILGATSTSGRAAITVARSLGAARIIGMSRNEGTLAAVDGLDERVVLQEPFTLPANLGPVHIVLDFVGGRAASGVLQAAELEPGKELQYIHIGDLAGEESIGIPARLLNSKSIRITGSGMGAWHKLNLKREIGGLLGAVVKIPRPEDVVTAPLADIQSIWDTEEAKTKRLVLMP